jgi:hypothetical protein
VSSINGSTSISNGTDTKLQFKYESYDYGSAFTASSGTIGSESATFKAPKSGVYHFDSRVSVLGWIGDISVANFNSARIWLNIMSPNGAINNFPGIVSWERADATSRAELAVSTDLKLAAGDKVYITISVNTDENEPNKILSAHFNGHLVFED